MNTTNQLFNTDLLLIIIKFVFVAVSIGNILVILVIEKQIRQADRVAAPFTHKLIELGGYINIVLTILALIIIILPI